MSQAGGPQEPTERTGTPGRYRRSTGGLTGALLVSVVAVLAFVGVRSLFAPDRPDPVRAIEYEAQVRAGREDDRLTVPAPLTLPDGWRATTAIYLTGVDPSWQLGLLTDQERFVGVFERLATVGAMVEEHVGDDAEEGATVEIGGEQWQEWSDPDGDYAVVREVEEPQGETGVVVVVGSAGEDVVRQLAGMLTTDTDATP